MIVAGVDDAGRGSFLGPLVVAGVAFHDHDVPTLVELGVKDSKLLSPRKREGLVTSIKGLAIGWQVVKIPSVEVDEAVGVNRRLRGLNKLEAKAMAKVIEALRPNVAFVDASDVVVERFKRYIAESLPFEVQIISEHKADRKYVVVAAASILAKVERDASIRELSKMYGNVGSGYVTDPRTIRFLKEYVKRHGSLPNFVRRSWKTARNLELNAKLKHLS